MAINTVVSGGPVEIVTSQKQFVGPDVQVASDDGKVGFFGKEPVVQIASAAVTDYATLKAALQAYGLIGA